MGVTAIRVEGLGKCYRRRRITGRIWRGWDKFWAVRDLSFSVPQGSAFGIIGANGAGKSTLLKILSRITEPTEGWAEVRGRVGALLDVGTGFHPDLSGRDNLYLSGTLLGMSRTEIASRLDEIVAFAEIGAFIDTPVKHFSSGMYVRLAFSVAVHFRADILIADEVLAVGDIEFQSKCIAKMQAILHEGRTALFVSHNMALVQKLCSNSILIERGRLITEGQTGAVIQAYVDRVGKDAPVDLSVASQRSGVGSVRLVRIEIQGEEGCETLKLVSGRPAVISLVVDRVMPGLTCSFTLYDQFGQPITYFDSSEHGRKDSVHLNSEAPIFRCEIPELLLVPGRYRMNAAVLLDGIIQDHIPAAAFLDVEQRILDGRPLMRTQNHGSALMHHRWTLLR